jgi:hypothetical protein
MYKITKIYSDNQSYTRIYRDEPKMEIEVDDSVGYIYIEKINKDGSNVSIDDLCNAIDSYLENWNYHDQIGCPAELADYLLPYMKEQQICEIYLKMIENRSLGWGI